MTGNKTLLDFVEKQSNHHMVDGGNDQFTVQTSRTGSVDHTDPTNSDDKFGHTGPTSHTDPNGHVLTATTPAKPIPKQSGPLSCFNAQIARYACSLAKYLHPGTIKTLPTRF